MKKIVSFILCIYIIFGICPETSFASYTQSSDIVYEIYKTMPYCAGELAALRVYDGTDLFYITDDYIADDDTFYCEIPGVKLGKKYSYKLTASGGDEVSDTFTVEYDNEAYSILDDDFLSTAPNAADGINNYSWDIYSGGGSVTNYDEQGKSRIPLTLNDTSANDFVSATRVLEETEKTRIALEYRMKISNLNVGAAVSLSYDDKNCIKIYENNGSLYCNDTYVCSIEASKDYGIRIDADLLTKQANIFVNGKRTEFCVELGKLNKICLSTAAESVGKFQIAPIKLTRGYYVCDNAIAFASMSRLDTDSQFCAKGYTNAALTRTFNYDIYSYNFAGAAHNPINFSKSFDEITKKAVFSFRLYSVNKLQEMSINFGDFYSYISDGDFYVRLANGEGKKVKTLREDFWHLFRITYDPNTGLSDIQINGNDLEKNVSVSSGGKTISSVCFAGGKNSDTFKLDDIMVFEYPTYDEYPSEPKTIKKSDNDVIVGMQECDIWQEGNHFGWEYLSEYNRRTPYLGYYDDGNTEAIDWQIKYMVEHGVDFMYKCWYQSVVSDFAINKPRISGYALDEGLFNARYKDKIKFALLWENSSLNPDYATLEGFKKYVVPYWMEYYFTNPNYLVLDNKIVLGVYRGDNLEKTYGAEGAKEAIAYLTEQVKTIPEIDGLYLIASGLTYKTSELQKLSDVGFDAVCRYSKTTYANTPARFIDKTAEDSNNGVIKSIPIVSTGFDSRPWNGSEGVTFTPSAVTDICKSIKESLFSKEQYTSSLDRLLMLDNWNEYGEGHFFMPSALAGFDYLEAVGSVFGQPEHIDEIPTDKERLGHLYKKTHDGGNETVNWSDNNTTCLLRYDFNSANEKPKTYYNITGLKTENGRLSGKASGNDPMFYSEDNLGIELKGNELIHIRYKTNSANLKTTVYFATDTDTEFSQDKSIAANVPSGAGDVTDVYFDLSKLSTGEAANSKWSGTLKRLRFDPFDNTPGSTFEYDLIELLRYHTGEDTPKKTSVVFDGFYSSNRRISYPVKEETDAAARITYNNSDYSSEYDVYIAEYDFGGRLDRITKSSDTVRLGKETREYSVSIQPDKLYRVFVWDKGLKPVLDTSNQRKTKREGNVKILFVGNSITIHPPSDALGWSGNWGMAATCEENDYVHRLMSAIHEKYPNVEYKIVSAWDFEKNFYDLSRISKDKYKEYINFDADIIICSIGANINNSSNEDDSGFITNYELTAENYRDIVNYFNPYNDAKIIPCITTLSRSVVRNTIRECVQAEGWECVDWSDLTSYVYTGKPYKSASVFSDNVSSGVLAHPGDYGMQIMAERLYEPTEKYINESIELR